jgi:hypothetical protein
MKITYNDLKMAYKAHIQRYIPASREGCPSEESILRVFEESLSPEKKEEIVDHVVKCAYCLREFELFLALVRDESKAAEEISGFLKERSRDANPPRKKPKIWGIISGSGIQHPPLWRIATISLVLLIITGLLLISTKLIFKPSLDEERGRLRDQVRLISPSQGQVGTFPLIFRWQKVTGAELYQLEIFDDSLSPLWKSPQIFVLFYELPPKVTEAIKENKVYFWMVTAFLPNGVKRESPLETFILTR